MVVREAERATVHRSSQALPSLLAVSVDGNGRWAQARRLPRSAGQRAEPEACVSLVGACQRLGIPILSIDVFSTVNWRRPEAEAGEVPWLVGETLKRCREPFLASGVRLRHLGRTAGLPDPDLLLCTSGEAVLLRVLDRYARHAWPARRWGGPGGLGGMPKSCLVCVMFRCR
jgi:hypothetical protein